MVKYIVKMIDKYSGEVLDTDDEKFDTYEDAEDFSLEWSLNYATGAEVLELAGRSFDSPDDIDFVVEEVEV
ncbi:hypothetical protein [Neobacillus sp. NPDC093127]|uniref:hypothetical protein n=1 Tax=Neobacillus sp. NPDC093127 TaxID=3364296 RepID=UPI003824E485